MLRSLGALLLAFAFCVAAVGQGRSTVVDMQAKGSGATSEAALRIALLDAVRRANSTIAVDVRPRFEDALADLERALSAPEITVAAVETNVSAMSKGLVERVRVLSQQATPTGVDVVILASVSRFEPSLATRRTLAVVPFRSSAGQYSFGDQQIPAPDITRRLNDRLVEQLVGSNVVTVLDRDFVEATTKEKSFVETYGRTPEELARFGKMLGADYLLVGSLEKAGLVVNTQTVEASGYTVSSAFAGLDASVRVVEVATGAILWAESVQAYLPNGELSRDSGAGGPNPGAVMERLVAMAAEEIGGRSIETIAPIKIAYLDSDIVWLNRGTGRLHPGDRLAVRGGGEEIRDPDTGESLGTAERTVAVIEVVATDPKKSQCRVLEGKLTDLCVGQRARPLTRP